jgi:hypothetical protein
MRKLFVPLVLLAAILALPVSGALAHPERTTFFPDHREGERPKFPTTGEIHTVCRPDSKQRIARIYKGKGPKTSRTRRLRLRQVTRCKFQEIQAAVNAATSGDRIRIFPGVYTEESSRKVTFNDPKCSPEDPKYWEPTNDSHGEDGKVPTYQFHVDCPNSRNLIQILGDDPNDPDRKCDQKCNLLLEGVGKSPKDVLIVGDRKKRDVLRVDRADGIYLKNFTTEQASFNGVDVVETNGFVLEKLVGNYNQNYGVLTFTSDNGLYDRVEGTGNGDSAIYPGSGPEGMCLRYGIEIKNSRSYGNTLGMSGTAGNGTYVHDTEFFNNGTGVVNDSFASGHPGMPQDCSKWENNKVYSNNNNFFELDNQKYCADTTFDKRPREHVCPQFQSPVGAGFAFYGRTTTSSATTRCGTTGARATACSGCPARSAATTRSPLSATPRTATRSPRTSSASPPTASACPTASTSSGTSRGDRNCWEGNKGLDNKMTSDPRSLPTCSDGGSSGAVSRPDKLAREASCATWDPKENPDPPGCDWFKTPPRPSSR